MNHQDDILGSFNTEDTTQETFENPVLLHEEEPIQEPTILHIEEEKDTA